MNNGDKIRLLDNDNLAEVFMMINQSCLKATLERFHLNIDEELLKKLNAEVKARWLIFLNKE